MTDKLLDIIDTALDEMAITYNLTGHDYVKEIVFCMCIGKLDRKESFSKVVYPYISEKFNTKPANVERCVKTVVVKSWNRSSDYAKIKNIGYSSIECSKPPSNKRFLIALAEEIDKKR